MGQMGMAFLGGEEAGLEGYNCLGGFTISTLNSMAT